MRSPRISSARPPPHPSGCPRSGSRAMRSSGRKCAREQARKKGHVKHPLKHYELPRKDSFDMTNYPVRLDGMVGILPKRSFLDVPHSVWTN